MIYTKYRNCVLLLFCLALVCCKTKQEKLFENIQSFSEFPKIDTLEFRNLYNYKKGVPGKIKLFDSTLICFNTNEGATHFLNDYSLKAGKLSNGYLRMGRGPGECIGAFEFGKQGNSLWVQDITLKKILIQQRDDKSENIHKHFNEFPVTENYYIIDFKDSTHYLGVGSVNSQYKIQETELHTGKIINEIGAFQNIPNIISLSAFKKAHQCFIHVKPDGNKAVLAYRFTDVVEIFDLNTEVGIIIQGPERFEVDYQPSGEQMFRNDKTRFAFVGGGGTVTNKYIYLFYSGELTKKKDSFYANSIFVYDWFGNPVKKIVLDRKVKGLAISEDDYTLYTCDLNTGFIVEANL